MLKYLMLSLGCSLLLIGCTSDESMPAEAAHAEEEVQQQGNRIALPPVVRNNLGVTFATAEYRIVTATVTVPGSFELGARAQHRLTAPTAGRVTMHVDALDAVEGGAIVAELEAPALIELQGSVHALEAEGSELAAQNATLESEIAARMALAGDEVAPVFAARREALAARMAALDQRRRQLLQQMATLVGESVEALRQPDASGRPRWAGLTHVPIRAPVTGTVTDLAASDGAWLAADGDLLSLAHAQELRFHGQALQADLVDHLRDGQLVTIYPPEGAGSRRREAGLSGSLQLGLSGDAARRTVDVFVKAHGEVPAWVRPGVAALAEVVVGGDGEFEELAIPQRALVQDGLDTVYFRRDPNDPDTVIRTTADAGASDGRWVTIFSGLGEGDEVVIDGAYQLKLASSGQSNKAGHFHADGTWHEGEH